MEARAQTQQLTWLIFILPQKAALAALGQLFPDRERPEMAVTEAVILTKGLAVFLFPEPERLEFTAEAQGRAALALGQITLAEMGQKVFTF
jgi:hypothetical protein